MWHGGKIAKHSLSSFNTFISETKYTYTTKKQIDDKILIHVVD
jgi:hypothetical protein